jgi:hypothetical protein
MADKIEVLNVNTPGRSTRVDAAKYQAMKSAMLAVAPDQPPGLTAKELKEATRPKLPEDLFPGGATSGWWQKCVQLDLEARGDLQRSKTSPLRFWKTGTGPKS